MDPSVPAPQLALIEAVPGQDVNVIAPSPLEEQADPDVKARSSALAATVGLSPRTFRFENFVGTTAQGQPVLLSRTVRRQVLLWYPLGTPAAAFLRFIGEIFDRAHPTLRGNGPTGAAQKGCLRMPLNKVFTEGTIVCTYRHTMPSSPPFVAPAASPATPPPDAFWIVAFSYNRSGALTGIEVHARETASRLPSARHP